MNATLFTLPWLLVNAAPLPTQNIAEPPAVRDQDGLVVQFVSRVDDAGLLGGSLSYDRRIGAKPFWLRPHLGFGVRYAAEGRGDPTLLVGCGIAYGIRYRATADGYLATGPRDHLSIEGVDGATHWGTDVTAAVGGEFMARSGFMFRMSFGVSYFVNLPPFAVDKQTWNPITLLHLGTKF